MCCDFLKMLFYFLKMLCYFLRTFLRCCVTFLELIKVVPKPVPSAGDTILSLLTSTLKITLPYKSCTQTSSLTQKDNPVPTDIHTAKSTCCCCFLTLFQLLGHLRLIESIQTFNTHIRTQFKVHKVKICQVLGFPF